MPTLDWERRLGYPESIVIGVDEVGRGCLAGPVVAGAVVLPWRLNGGSERLEGEPKDWIARITDSKLLKAGVRDELSEKIWTWAGASAVGVASVEEIDEINILRASHLAMFRAVEAALKTALETAPAGCPVRILVDGNQIPREFVTAGWNSQAVVKGDRECLSIACASIIAKVWRDRHLQELDAEYPGYGLAVHKGYPTPVHLQALRERGVTGIHRRSFGPVKQVLG